MTQPVLGLDEAPESTCAACTLGHFMLPILHFRPHYGSNGRSGGVLGGQFLAGDPALAAKIWFQPWPDYGLSNMWLWESSSLRMEVVNEGMTGIPPTGNGVSRS